jgi:hypothetical protein
MVLSKRKLLGFFFMLLIFAAASRPITDPDFWWHLRTGQYIVETKSIPHSDIFSTLRLGSEWVTHEWLSEVLMYYLFRPLGFAGLIGAFALIIMASFWITYRRCQLRVPYPYVVALALLLGTAATIPTWGVRPQMFSILFASVVLIVLDKYCRDENKRLIWWLIPVMVLWVNMHAGFAVGLALILLTILGQALDGLLLDGLTLVEIWPRVRTLCLLWIVALAVVGINPNGLRMYSYPFETLRSSSMMRYIQEWKSPNFQDPAFQALLILILVTFCVLALSNKRPRPSELLILTATGAATLRSARNVPFFALIAMPILADYLWILISSQTSAKRLTISDDRVVPNKSMLSVALSLVLFVAVPITAASLRLRQATTKQSQTEAENFPLAAAEFLRAQDLPPPIYNEYHWGGYLIWKLYPSYRVYIDGRADVYGDALIEEFFVVHDGETEWRRPLDNHGIQTVMVEPDSAIASLLRQDPGWKKVFEDKQAVIFVRAKS